MANTRMAGDELEKDTPESKGAKAAVVQAKDDNWNARAQRYEDEDRRESKLGAVDREKYGLEGYSDKDIFMSFKGDEFGDKDYERLTGKKFGGGDDDKPAENNTQVEPQRNTVQAGTGNANNNSASNSSTINGNNNSVDQSITQSINNSRTYGGTNKSFTYNGSSNGNNYEDTPVSAGTMAGHFYDGDSPTKSAAFLDRYTTMNDDYQKSYENRGRAQTAINAASKNEAIDFDEMDQRIGDRAKASRARSTVMAGEIFGDMWNYKAPDWRNPDKMEEVEAPDFKKLGKI
jgi:hypothetical protein